MGQSGQNYGANAPKTMGQICKGQVIHNLARHHGAIIGHTWTRLGNSLSAIRFQPIYASVILCHQMRNWNHFLGALNCQSVKFRFNPSSICSNWRSLYKSAFFFELVDNTLANCWSAPRLLSSPNALSRVFQICILRQIALTNVNQTSLIVIFGKILISFVMWSEFYQFWHWTVVAPELLLVTGKVLGGKHQDPLPHNRVWEKELFF